MALRLRDRLRPRPGRLTLEMEDGRGMRERGRGRGENGEGKGEDGRAKGEDDEEAQVGRM